MKLPSRAKISSSEDGENDDLSLLNSDNFGILPENLRNEGKQDEQNFFAEAELKELEMQTPRTRKKTIFSMKNLARKKSNTSTDGNKSKERDDDFVFSPKPTFPLPGLSSPSFEESQEPAAARNDGPMSPSLLSPTRKGQKTKLKKRFSSKNDPSNKTNLDGMEVSERSVSEVSFSEVSFNSFVKSPIAKATSLLKRKKQNSATDSVPATPVSQMNVLQTPVVSSAKKQSNSDCEWMEIQFDALIPGAPPLSSPQTPTLEEEAKREEEEEEKMEEGNKPDHGDSSLKEEQSGKDTTKKSRRRSRSVSKSPHTPKKTLDNTIGKEGARKESRQIEDKSIKSHRSQKSRRRKSAKDKGNDQASQKSPRLRRRSRSRSTHAIPKSHHLDESATAPVTKKESALPTIDLDDDGSIVSSDLPSARSTKIDSVSPLTSPGSRKKKSEKDGSKKDLQSNSKRTSKRTSKAEEKSGTKKKIPKGSRKSKSDKPKKSKKSGEGDSSALRNVYGTVPDCPSVGSASDSRSVFPEFYDDMNSNSRILDSPKAKTERTNKSKKSVGELMSPRLSNLYGVVPDCPSIGSESESCSVVSGYYDDIETASPRSPRHVNSDSKLTVSPMTEMQTNSAHSETNAFQSPSQKQNAKKLASLLDGDGNGRKKSPKSRRGKSHTNQSPQTLITSPSRANVVPKMYDAGRYVTLKEKADIKASSQSRRSFVDGALENSMSSVYADESLGKETSLQSLYLDSFEE